MNKKMILNFNFDANCRAKWLKICVRFAKLQQNSVLTAWTLSEFSQFLYSLSLKMKNIVWSLMTQLWRRFWRRILEGVKFILWLWMKYYITWWSKKPSTPVGEYILPLHGANLLKISHNVVQHILYYTYKFQENDIMLPKFAVFVFIQPRTL